MSCDIKGCKKKVAYSGLICPMNVYYENLYFCAYHFKKQRKERFVSVTKLSEEPRDE